jgi:formylglycine-generating enzyme required for sulfatase activity
MLKPGSLVFAPPRRPVDLQNWMQWWRFEFGANWRRPYGRGKPNQSLEGHPVVHIAYQDAEAYATWAGKALPTEAEWEYAARGGLDGAEFAWGDELTPGGRHMANTWQGAFSANGYGLFDMIGNVWEWTTDWFSARHHVSSPCCIPSDPRGGAEAGSLDLQDSAPRIPRKIVKGGSHLCAPNYCRRYRPAARHAQPVDTGMSHVGFRCVLWQ